MSPWIPTEHELQVAECLGVGLSQNATARKLSIHAQRISDLYQRDEFRALVADMSAKFIANRDYIHDQQVWLAQMVVFEGLSGARDAGTPEVRLAVNLLASTYWKQKAGETYKPFGQS